MDLWFMVTDKRYLIYAGRNGQVECKQYNLCEPLQQEYVVL